MGDYLRAGSLALRSTSHGGFEILQLDTDRKGILIASGEVHRTSFPTLHVDKLAPQERLLTAGTTTLDKAVLQTWPDSHHTHYELRAEGAEDRIAIFLTGHKRFRCFWWRVDFTLLEGEVAIRGPFLAADCDS